MRKLTLIGLAVATLPMLAACNQAPAGDTTTEEVPVEESAAPAPAEAAPADAAAAPADATAPAAETAATPEGGAPSSSGGGRVTPPSE